MEATSDRTRIISELMEELNCLISVALFDIIVNWGTINDNNQWHSYPKSYRGSKNRNKYAYDFLLIKGREKQHKQQILFSTR